MYETKHFFKIPAKYSSVLYSMAVTVNGKELNEIIYNNDFVLIDKDVKEISLLTSNKRIRIPVSTIPSSILINARYDATVNIIDGLKIKKIGILPYVYTKGKVDADYLIIIPNSDNYLLKEVFVGGEQSEKLEKKEIKFKSSPKLKFNDVTFEISPKGDDSQKLIYLDSLSEVINREITKNKKIKEDFYSLFSTRLFSFHKKSTTEKELKYNGDKKVFSKLVDENAKEIISNSGMSIIQSSYYQKLDLIENYRSDILDRQGSNSGHILNKVFFVELSMNLGKNMPHAATNPGPSKLFAGGGAIQFYHPLSNRLNGFARASGHYSQWYFNENFTEKSTLLDISCDYGVSFPFKPPINIKNIVKYVDVNPFVTAGYSILNVENHDAYEEKKPYFGGGLGLDVRITSLPIILGGNYSYNSTKFGDLVVLIKVPVYWMNK